MLCIVMRPMLVLRQASLRQCPSGLPDAKFTIVDPTSIVDSDNVSCYTSSVRIVRGWVFVD